jgi:ABC-type Fe3+-siderophore transport system permease subunit
MSEQFSSPPVSDSKPPSDEQKRLVTLFDDLDKGQLAFLDEAGKRIIELVTAILGILFAVTAFGDDFPPPYLENNTAAKILIVITLIFQLGALLAGVWAVQPRDYRRYEHNLTEMRKELNEIISHKARWLKIAGVLFVGGALSLATLIIAIVFSA